MTVGEKITELRKEKGMTQKKLAETIGGDDATVCHWEKGNNEPSLFSSILLADVFGKSLDELACRDFKGANRYEKVFD